MSVGPINLSELKRIHERFKRRHEAVVKDATRVAGAHATEHVRRNSLFKRRSASSLKDDTKPRVIKTRGGKILRLKWSKKHAPFIEYGTRRHRITAKRSSLLRFFWRKGPRGPGIYYYRSVMHPGTRPYKFGWKASHSAHRVLGQRLREGMARAATKF